MDADMEAVEKMAERIRRRRPDEPADNDLLLHLIASMLELLCKASRSMASEFEALQEQVEKVNARLAAVSRGVE